MGPLATAVQRLFDTGFDADNIPLYLEGFSTDCEVTALGVHLTGRQQFGALLNNFRAAFSENKHSVIGSVEDGNCVVVELQWTAKHTGPLHLGDQVLEASGRSLEWTVCEWDWFSEGRIVRSHIYADQSALVAQLSKES